MELKSESFITHQRNKCDQLLLEVNVTELHCPPIFDGLLCWPSTAASQIVTQQCPPSWVLGYDVFDNEDRISELDHTFVASKICLDDGEWFKNSDNVMWSNFTLCTPSNYRYVESLRTIVNIPMDILPEYGRVNDPPMLSTWLPIIRIISQAGYITSFGTLIIAMVIFSTLRKLRNPRNRLHMHLFVSFIMRAFMALLKDWIFVDGVGVSWDVVFVDESGAFIKERNTWICKAITSMWQYFIVANYAWILMEGLYLHNLVFLAPCTESSNSIIRYVISGWGLPSLVVIPWIIVRAMIEDTLCWTIHVNASFFLIISVPIMISILLNFCLYINVVRVLLAKLKTSQHLQRKKMHYGKWAKSTLVLVPLFGVHYTLLLGLSYYKDHRVELIWLFCDQLFASFQGCFIASLYCLLNGEVRAEIRRTWKVWCSARNFKWDRREALMNFRCRAANRNARNRRTWKGWKSNARTSQTGQPENSRPA